LELTLHGPKANRAALRSWSLQEVIGVASALRPVIMHSFRLPKDALSHGEMVDSRDVFLMQGLCSILLTSLPVHPSTL
jgi:hypothetical protein